MRLPFRDAPPPLTVVPTYRELYEHGAFAQRGFETEMRLAGIAKDRQLAHWIGQEVPETDDIRGALCPIAFATGPHSAAQEMPPADSAAVAFREESGPRPWSDYAWDAWGHPNVSPLYSPWQSLYIDVVARETTVAMPIDLLLGPVEKLDEQLSQIRWLIDKQREIFESIDESWRPLIKVLVAVQNVYWPQVCGRVVVTAAPGGEYHDAGDTREAPEALLERVGCSVDELTAVYHFLVERGLASEPRDEGMVNLRRFVQREYHVRWRGPVRHAQDHFDAAQMLYLWLSQLTGSAPTRPDSWPADGRQAQRMALYDNGPASRNLSEALKKELIEIELYPHGPAVIGEGPSERILVDALVKELLWFGSAFEFHDLEGSGAAARVPRLVEILNNYASEAFVIVDNEGDMARYIDKAVADGKLDRENVLLHEDSLEQSNFSPAELIEVAAELAAHPPEGREPASPSLAADTLLGEHSKRCERANQHKPGLAETLLSMAAWPEHGSVRISKRELAEGLAARLVAELRQARADQGIEALTQQRPIVRFVIERLCPTLNRPRPIS